jgi:hypothetical protein
MTEFFSDNLTALENPFRDLFLKAKFYRCHSQ